MFTLSLIRKRAVKFFLNHHLSPNSLIWRLLFSFFRTLYNSSILSPNANVEVLITPCANLILLPLSGSSTLRRIKSCRLSRNVQPGKPIFLICRNSGLRMQSFYNKKIRNPDTIGKCILLAGCSPLTYHSSIEQFFSYLDNMPLPFKRDKHLWTIGETIAALNLPLDSVHLLDISLDTDQIEELLGHKLSQRCNATSDVASFQSPVFFDDTTLSRANSIFINIDHSMGWLT